MLPTAELAINSLPNRSTGYSPFFLMYGYNPVLPIELIKGDEVVSNEMVSTFVRAHENDLAKSTSTVEKEYKDARRIL